MMWPSRHDWLFSAKAFLASMIALYIGLAFDLPRPYWAMAAVYIVANPLSGATSSKGVYRAMGTLLGATASVFFVPLFVTAPELLTVIVALWTGTLLYISLLDRTPRNYTFMLAGYTLPLISLPVLGTPEAIFDTAVARSEEIILGIVCASVVGTLVFPSRVGATLSARLSSLFNDTASWADEILRSDDYKPAVPLTRQRLAADISALDLLITQLFYDTQAGEAMRHAREMRGRLMILLPYMASLADRLHALHSLKGKLPEGLKPLLLRVADWIQAQEAAPGTTKPLHAAIMALAPPAKAQDWDDLILASALTRLREIVELWEDCLNLRARIATDAATPWRPAFRSRRVVGVRYYDYAMLVFSAGTTVLAIIAMGALWIATGWPSGSGFVVLGAVACCFFAGLDRPAVMIRELFYACFGSIIVAGFYLFVVLPYIHDFEMMVLCFAPVFLVLGTLMVRPRYALIATLVGVNGATFVALQNRFSADFAQFLNDSLAAQLGVGFAWVWTLIVRPFGAEIAARRLVRAGWQDIADAASGRYERGEHLAVRMLDRLGQLVPRLASLDDNDISRADGLAEVRIGFNLADLQRMRGRVSATAGTAIDGVLESVAALFKARLEADKALPPSATICDAIDSALGAAALEANRRGRRVADALVGLRRALFPHAGPPGSAMIGEGMPA